MSIHKAIPSLEKINTPDVRHIGKVTDYPFVELKNNADLRIRLFPNGLIYDISKSDQLINLQLGNSLSGSLSRLYLRRINSDGINYHLMNSNRSDCQFHVTQNSAIWSGEWGGCSYICVLRLHPEHSSWKWDVSITSSEDQGNCAFDVIYMQDVGIAHRDAILSNESYVSQYIDHQIFEQKPYGRVLVSRQNSSQNGFHPQLIQACLTGGMGCLTDGYDIFGTTSRIDGKFKCLSQENIGTERKQYEFSCGAIQSEVFRLHEIKQSKSVSFGCSYRPDNIDTTSIDCLDDLQLLSQWDQSNFENHIADSSFSENRVNEIEISSNLICQDLDERDLALYFQGDHRHIERNSNGVLSFFYDNDSHVVLRQKEIAVNRPHGHILRFGESLLHQQTDFCLTSWMNGAFLSHIAYGNTSHHKFMSLPRNPLDVLRHGGMRISVNLDGEYQMLGLPSAFEMSRSHCRWIYQFDERVIEVIVRENDEQNGVTLEADVIKGEPISFMILSHLIMGVNDWNHDMKVNIDHENHSFEVIGDEYVYDNRIKCPTYEIQAEAEGTELVLGMDELLSTNSETQNLPYLVIRTGSTRSIALNIRGVLDASQNVCEMPLIHGGSDQYWRQLECHSTLRHANVASASELDDMMKWFSHNAIIHMSSPHGLEQYSGAAWGVRDVCQGPTEYLLALSRFSDVRKIIEIVFSQQYLDSGDWPQWFMFGEYRKLRQIDSHGDIIVWPLKSVCDYLEATMDWQILDQELPYVTDSTLEISEQRNSLLDHVKKAIQTIESRFIEGTSLVRFGDGDWNDSLQPASDELRDKLVSTWTVEILYQTLKRFAKLLKVSGYDVELAEHLEDICAGIETDFQEILLKDHIVAGFVTHEAKSRWQYLLHPSDDETGVKYRLLPYTRGMISEIFTPEQANQHFKLIENQLKHADGVRLMDRPMRYMGGEEKIFKRAESCASFLREISLHYIHAHLRYCEAMAKLGKADELYLAIRQVNPVGLSGVVKNADLRQSNAYFSSSDAAFSDRYESYERFDELRDGQVQVNGGWRIYSSGPGITYGLVVGRMLGFRRYLGNIVIDSIIPKELDGLEWTVDYEGKPVKFVFYVALNGNSVEAVRINGREVEAYQREENRYREGGIMIPKDHFDAMLCGQNRVIEVMLR
ncbi:GH36-type glycosyl hydrolase domain-containing protein [Poriferisphaera corsica]|nr:hypothetical protein [Poriferisphaera corsica]